MIIVQVAGGLGNQMQQYALYRKFLSLGKEAKLDISWFTESDRQRNVYAGRKLELLLFESLAYEVCTDEEKSILVGKDGLMDKIARKLIPGRNRVFIESEMYHPEIFALSDCYLCGYWASERYYADIMEELRQCFRFPLPEQADLRNKRAADQMQSEESVSIHIRRGDYLDVENAAMFGNICTEEYYDSAVREMKCYNKNAHFYIFSDDLDYVREKYKGEEYSVVDWNKGENSFYDIWLMSQCKNNICANSTFSFWGARLNHTCNKKMIRPSKHKNSQVFDEAVMHELWKGWILIDPKGRVYGNDNDSNAGI